MKQALRERAARRGRSLEEEVREILRVAAAQEDAPLSDGLGTRIARRFAGLGLTEDVPELRGQVARAADLGG